MTRRLALAMVAVIGCASPGSDPPAATKAGTLQSLTPEARLAYLREAAVWAPVDPTTLDLRRGPAGGQWPPGHVLECDFVIPAEKPGGYSPKFLCRAADGKTYKIKYGTDNPEVYSEVIGSRLLWALGFATDRIDPVKVRCRGCPEDPWKFLTRDGEREDLSPDVVRHFEPAVIETYRGVPMESEPDQGVEWEELLSETSRDPEKAREQRARREALALLMAFLQHADSKASQQTLGCPPDGVRRDASGAETCVSPEVYVGDVGGILGEGFNPRKLDTSKLEYEDWRDTPVWRDAEECEAAVNGRPNASLRDFEVSEPGRRFLAERLSLLTRDQIREIFAAANIERFGGVVGTTSGERPTTADDWAATFVEKSKAIIDHRCPTPAE